jgi:hypothetical protein
MTGVDSGNTGRTVRALGAIAGLVILVGAAAADSQTWEFDLQTSGEDVFYTSPTAVCAIAPLYDAAYEISAVEVWVSYLSLPFGPFDVTDEIPPEWRSGSYTVDGPPPFVIVDEYIRYPEPPDPITLAADLRIDVDGDGYGHAAATDVVLGTATYDLGWPFGVVEVQIETVRMAGTVWVTSFLTGDLDGDDDVDLQDLAQLLAHYGTASGATPDQGDLDGDGDVDLGDLAEMLANYGLSC